LDFHNRVQFNYLSVCKQRFEPSNEGSSSALVVVGIDDALCGSAKSRNHVLTILLAFEGKIANSDRFWSQARLFVTRNYTSGLPGRPITYSIYELPRHHNRPESPRTNYQTDINQVPFDGETHPQRADDQGRLVGQGQS